VKAGRGNVARTTDSSSAGEGLDESCPWKDLRGAGLVGLGRY
jgi:hypothetical protein